tara:strand:+ start:298 stop:615 length:318 start_codon:yes stop_codon:yes gene_type:complete
MLRLVICFLFLAQAMFSNSNSVSVEFDEISFNEYKLQKLVEVELKNIFARPERRILFQGTPLSDLINKFYNTNHLSLKIKRSNERENELKISFSKSSLCFRYILD